MTQPPWRSTRGTWPAVAVVVLATLASHGCAAPEPPRPAPPGVVSRIVSLVPAVTEMLFAIDAGSEVVGVSSFDTYPPEVSTRTKVGALVDPDFERILTLNPDLVVVYGTQAELVGRLERARIPFFPYEHAGLADVTTTIAALGQRIGRSAEAERLVARIRQDLDEVRASVAARVQPRVLLLFGRDPGTLRNMYASAGSGFLHDLVTLAGGADALADVPRQSLQVSAETILTRAPDVIIEAHPSSWDTADVERERAVWQTLPSLPAVRSNRIHIVADDRLFIPGPRVADAAKLLAELIHR
jgi:iron complex transport system substrate-binding protein